MLPRATREDKKLAAVSVILMLLPPSLAISFALPGPPGHPAEADALRSVGYADASLVWLSPVSTGFKKRKEKCPSNRLDFIFRC